MQAYVTLVRRELGGFFVSLTGYAVIAAILLLMGICLVDMLFKLQGQPTDTPLTEMFYNTYYFWWILVFTAPITTMRSFAIEKSSGTFETLMTAPVSDLQVVLAKFTGTLLFYLLTWIPLFGCVAFVRFYTNESTVFDWQAAASTLLGIGLIGCLYVSLGCFASSLTRSQIIAAMNGFVLGLGLFLLSLRQLVPAPPGDWAAKALSYISMTEHMQDFARGVVDTRHVVFFLSFTVFFLYLTLKVVESRRWK
jgi:ABC-2 type transport system permease protein